MSIQLVDDDEAVLNAIKGDGTFDDLRRQGLDKLKSDVRLIASCKACTEVFLLLQTPWQSSDRLLFWSRSQSCYSLWRKACGGVTSSISLHAMVQTRSSYAKLCGETESLSESIPCSLVSLRASEIVEARAALAVDNG